MYPALHIIIDPGERIAGGTTQSVIRVHDTYTGYSAGTPVNSEAIADLTNTNYWQVWNGTAWVTASVAPALTDNKNGSSPLKYRYLPGAWQTTTTPTRGNGPHTLTTTAMIP